MLDIFQTFFETENGLCVFREEGQYNMIEFLDINGERQSFNDKGSFNTAFNADCMELLRNCPNNTFDICVCDPPYGAGFTEGGGCKGWVTKYHQDTCSQSVNAERERGRAAV